MTADTATDQQLTSEHDKLLFHCCYIGPVIATGELLLWKP
jgi:hypothetical protein